MGLRQTNLRQATLAVIIYENKLLLGMKKRGFGKGRYNGFGGKPEPDESLIDCVCRETQEEAKVILNKEGIDLVAIIDFYFTNKPKDWDQQVYVYKATDFEGSPEETDEMKPQEFPISELPYDKMWPDDIYWLPRVLEGKKVRARFTFGEDGSVVDHVLEEVQDIQPFLSQTRE